MRACPVFFELVIFAAGFAIEGGGLFPEFFGVGVIESRRKAVIKFNDCSAV